MKVLACLPVKHTHPRRDSPPFLRWDVFLDSYSSWRQVHSTSRGRVPNAMVLNVLTPRAAAAAPGSLLERPILKPYPRPSESETRHSTQQSGPAQALQVILMLGLKSEPLASIIKFNYFEICLMSSLFFLCFVGEVVRGLSWVDLPSSTLPPHNHQRSGLSVSFLKNSF